MILSTESAQLVELILITRSPKHQQQHIVAGANLAIIGLKLLFLIGVWLVMEPLQDMFRYLQALARPVTAVITRASIVTPQGDICLSQQPINASNAPQYQNRHRRPLPMDVYATPSMLGMVLAILATLQHVRSVKYLAISQIHAFAILQCPSLSQELARLART
jgi:hypothetical protein